MILQEFINKYNNKYISILTPGKNCFDLVVQWTDNLGIPHFPNNPSPFPYQSAYEIYANFGTFQAQYFERIPNGLFNSPEPGDIMVWKPGYNNGAGHTGVVVRAGMWTFDAFEQNDPVGSPCQVRTYSYGYMSKSGVFGWLHYRVMPQDQIKTIKEMVNKPVSDTDFRNWVRTYLGV